MAFVRWTDSALLTTALIPNNNSNNNSNNLSLTNTTVPVSRSSDQPLPLKSQPEIFWRNYQTGELRSWQVVNGQVTNVKALPTMADFSWQLDATVDFNRDGETDLLWRNQRSGAVVIWQMQAGQIAATQTLQATAPDTNFTIVGVADWNQDGGADLLSFNYQTGATQIWQMNGTKLDRKIDLLTVTDTNWRVQGLGDFNRDGQVDILWQHTTNGAVSFWAMNQTQLLGIGQLPKLTDTNLQLSGIEDLDRDGNLDFVWRNKVSGDVVIWKMQDNQIQQSVTIDLVKNFNLGLDWRLEKLGDFNNDGNIDVLWHNPTTGGTGLWQLDKTRIKAVTPLKTETQVGWKIESFA
jgi:hypothetical protein